MRRRDKSWPTLVGWIVSILLVLRIFDLTFTDPTDASGGRAKYDFCVAQSENLTILCFLGLQ